MALCGSLYRLAKDVNFDAIVTYSTRLRREVGEFPRRLVRAPRAGVAALSGLHPLGRRQDPVKEAPKTWRITHYPAGVAPSRDYAVRAPSLDAARRKLAYTRTFPGGPSVRTPRSPRR